MSGEIPTFYERHGVGAVTPSPYPPTTNVQAKRYVAEPKNPLLLNTTGPIERFLSLFLFLQLTTVHTGTGVIPAKAMFGSELPSLLNAILPAAAAHSEPSEKMVPHSTLLRTWEPAIFCWCVSLTRNGLYR